jgi:S-DNA-T family DNA segregation ATPase FtsK/SpoIIIE
MENDGNPTLESLLREMIANQHSINETARDLYEKLDRIEKRMETTDLFDSLSDKAEDYFEDAKEAVLEAGKASTSYLQRKLRVGYSLAATIMDQLEAEGVIGPADGSKAREVFEVGE